MTPLDLVVRSSIRLPAASHQLHLLEAREREENGPLCEQLLLEQEARSDLGRDFDSGEARALLEVRRRDSLGLLKSVRRAARTGDKKRTWSTSALPPADLEDRISA